MSIIKFRAENEPPSHKRIRIAVATDDEGNWVARGGSEYDEYTIDELLEDEQDHMEGNAKQQYWLVVDIPLPATEVLANQSPGEE